MFCFVLFWFDLIFYCDVIQGGVHITRSKLTSNKGNYSESNFLSCAKKTNKQKNLGRIWHYFKVFNRRHFTDSALGCALIWICLTAAGRRWPIDKFRTVLPVGFRQRRVQQNGHQHEMIWTVRIFFFNDCLFHTEHKVELCQHRTLLTFNNQRKSDIGQFHMRSHAEALQEQVSAG